MISRPRHPLLAALLPAAAIVLAWSVFFWRVLTPVESDRLTFQQGDFTLQFLAYRQLAYRQLAAGRFPVFEECLYSGYPFLADPQAQVLYPPVLGLMGLGRLLGWSDYPLRALEWEVMGHVLLAALAMYAFLRALRLRAMAAVFGALAFAFGGFLTGYAMLQTAILETAAWLPLILLALRFLALRGARWAAAAAALAAVAYTAGHPQTVLMAIYAGGAAYLYWAARARLGWRRTLGRGALVVMLTVGLAAAQLIPSLGFMLASTRAALPFDKAGGGFVIQDVALFVLTGVTNIWQPLYAGIITLALAGVALAAGRWTGRRYDTWLWLGIGLGGLALSFGANALGFDLAYLAAPGYRQFQSQERHALVATLALSILGAIGLQVLLTPLRARARRLLWRGHRRLAELGLAAAGLLIAVLVLARIAPARPEASAIAGAIAGGVALLTIGLLLSGGLFAWRTRLGRVPRRAWGMAVLAVLAFDLFTADRYTATQKPADPFPPQALLQPIAPAGPRDIARVYNHYGLPLNAACVNGAHEIGGGSPIALRRYQSFLARVPEDVYSQLLNVRYTVTWRGGMGTDNGRQIPATRLASAQYQGTDANLFQLDWPAGVQPAWVATAVTVAASEEAVYRRLAAGDFDPFAEAVVEAGSPILAGASGQPGRADLEGRAPGYMKIAAVAGAPGVLVVSEAFHWNWVARVNGAETRPVVVDGALLGVPLAAGVSVIEMSYRPDDFYAGGAASLTTILIMTIGFLFRKLPYHRPRVLDALGTRFL